MPGSIGPKRFRLWPCYNSGSDHATISNIWITICFITYSNKYNYCLQTTNFSALYFSVALAQHTTGITTSTTLAAASGNCPLAPHMRPCAPCRRFEWLVSNPPSLWMYFWGCQGCVWPSKRSFAPAMINRHNIGVFLVRAIHTLNSPKNYIRLLGGLLSINLMHQRGAQGLMWGTNGPSLPAAAMVRYGCVGRCWPLEAYVRSTYCRNSKNCLRKYFFIPT